MVQDGSPRNENQCEKINIKSGKYMQLGSYKQTEKSFHETS